MPCHSIEMQHPPKVDVVVSETLGNYPFEEHIIETLNDARARFLKPKGALIPRALTQFVAPVVSDRIHRELTAWDACGFDLSVPRSMSLNNIYVRALEPKELLDAGASAKAWDTIDFAVKNGTSRKGEAQWRLDRAATIHGFATWWQAELAPGIALSTAPGAPRTHWEQLYFPLLAPIEARSRETVAVTLSSRTSMAEGTHVAWTAAHRDGNGREQSRQALNLDKGYLP
jgi:protein arginine N-methyltransferase 1